MSGERVRWRWTRLVLVAVATVIVLQVLHALSPVISYLVAMLILGFCLGRLSSIAAGDRP